MTNILPTDANSILYEGLRDASGQQFVAKAAGTVTTDGGGVKSAPTKVTNDGSLALETGGNLATLVAHSPAKGQATMANSTPVAIASDQSAVPVSAASLPLPTNAVQETGGNLATLLAHTPALGQATMANSAPVAIASDQGNIAIKGGFTEVAGAGTGVVTGVGTDFIAALDVSAYKWASLQMTGSFSLTLQFQGSNDNSTFVAIPLITETSFNGAGSAGGVNMSAVGLYGIPIAFRYLRVRSTVWASNASLAGNLELDTVPPPWFFTTITNNAGASTVGGTTDYHLISAASTNANLVKNSGGQVYGWSIGNNAATDAYVKLYNSSSAPTAGSGTPLRTIYVPAKGSIQYHNSVGIAFGTGIGLTIVTNMVDTDATAIAINQVAVELDYK